jgi:mRNA-degrading endonuclease RelE of RelBE toxin-antitoxin system
MAKVFITPELFKEIRKTFKKESNDIIDILETLEENPQKGKELGCVGSIVIKEIKYKVYRFYFITDGYKVKFLKSEELTDLIIKFVRMSDKDKQQNVINQIKDVLRKLGAEGF